MSVPECRRIASVLTQLFEADAEFQAEIRSIACEGLDPRRITAAMSKRLDGDDVALLEAEFKEMPTAVSETLVVAWMMADRAGKSFNIVSQHPSSVTASARERRVDVTTSMDEHGVTVSIAHVPGFKANWYRPRAVAAA